MNAPMLWVILPGVLAGILTIFSGNQGWTRWGGLGSAAGLALLAKVVPIGSSFRLGLWDITISPQLTFFGRRFLLQDADRPLLFALYLLLSVWFLLGTDKVIPVKIIPLGLVAFSLIGVGYAVEPVFYAAIFFGFLAMACVILLSPSDEPPTRGVMRFLTYQILGMMCILFAAWLLSWIEVETVERLLVTRTMVLMGIGFSFLLGIFPFTSWISLLAEENHPFTTAFVFTFYLNGVLLFTLKYLHEIDWAFRAVDVPGYIRTVGVLMILIGGVSAVFLTHLGRMMGAAVIVELGRSLVSFSFLPVGRRYFFMILIIQGIALALWSFCVTKFWTWKGDVTYPQIEGFARASPLHAGGVFVGLASIAGIPFLGGLPIHWSLAALLTAERSSMALWFWVGNLGLAVGGIRMLSVMVGDRRVPGRPPVRDLERGIILIGCALLLLAGLFPHVLSRWVSPVAGAFR